jgi:hypothetical protein
MLNNRLIGNVVDCWHCVDLLENKMGQNWAERAWRVRNCEVCEGTLRDPIPWSELFMMGREFFE